MILIANNGLEEAGCLLTRNTVQNWIIKDFEYYKPVVINLLKSTKGRINIIFNL